MREQPPPCLSCLLTSQAKSLIGRGVRQSGRETQGHSCHRPQPCMKASLENEVLGSFTAMTGSLLTGVSGRTSWWRPQSPTHTVTSEMPARKLLDSEIFSGRTLKAIFKQLYLRTVSLMGQGPAGGAWIRTVPSARQAPHCPLAPWSPSRLAKKNLDAWARYRLLQSPAHCGQALTAPSPCPAPARPLPPAPTLCPACLFTLSSSDPSRESPVPPEIPFLNYSVSLPPPISPPLALPFPQSVHGLSSYNTE